MISQANLLEDDKAVIHSNLCDCARAGKDIGHPTAKAMDGLESVR